MSDERRHKALWALFRETAPLTGKVMGADLEPYLDWLIEQGYVVFDFQPKWAVRDNLGGWMVYQITPAGVQAIRDEYRRDVYTKLSWGITDSFTDGLIPRNTRNRNMKNISSNSVLQFVDLVVLRCIIESIRSGAPLPTARALGPPGHLLGQWLTRHQVDASYASSTDYKRRVEQAITRLRSVGLVVPQGRYTPTERGLTFFEDTPEVGVRWQDWPLSVPIMDGKLDFNGATYAPALWS